MGGPQGMMGGGFGGGRGQPNQWIDGGMAGGGRGMEGLPGFAPGGPDDPAMGGTGYMGGGQGGWKGHPGMRGPQDMVQPGGPNPWQQFPGGWSGGGPEGRVGPIGAFPNMPPQFQGGPPAGGWGGHRGGGFGNQLGAMPGMSGERGIPGGFGGRPEAGPPVPRRLPGRDRY